MQGPVSMLSMTAAAFYGLVVAASIAACFTARSNNQRPWNFRIWVATAILFVFLIASRVLGLEEMLRADLRDMLRAADAIDGRRTWQGYLIAAAIPAFAVAGLFAAYRLSRGIVGKRNIAVAVAAAGGAVMAGLIALRIISLHAMDQLLFGPLKLNWVGDIGASAIVLASAIYYIQRVRGSRT